MGDWSSLKSSVKPLNRRNPKMRSLLIQIISLDQNQNLKKKKKTEWLKSTFENAIISVIALVVTENEK